MTLKRFDPEKRKMLLALDKDGFDKACKSRETGEFLLDEAVQIIPLPLNEEHSSHPVLQQLVKSNLLATNTMLIEDPFNTGQYLKIDRFTEQTQLAKAELFSLLCQKLGAKKVIFHVDQSSHEHDTANANASMAGAAKNVVDPELSANAKTSKKLRDILTADYEYDGHQPTDKDFAEADAFMKQHGLDTDDACKNLLAFRQHKNSLKQRNVLLDLTRETENLLNLAAKFSIKIGTEELAGIKNSIDLQSEKTQKLVIKTTVIFA